MNNIELKALYEQNKELVTLKESVNYPGLFVMKYRKKVFFDNLWNDFLEEARGLVVDKDFNIISRPFLKIYNFGVEDRAPVFHPEERVKCFRKVNGFMVAITLHNNELLVSTTGSLDSDFVTLAKKYITPQLERTLKAWSVHSHPVTYMFECCAKEDPHIIEEQVGMYLIGARFVKSGELATEWIYDMHSSDPGFLMRQGMLPVEADDMTVAEVVRKSKSVKHEGFVFYSEDGRATKIKSQHYLIKKALMRGRVEKFASLEGRFELDEEFYPLYDHIHKNAKEEFFALDEMQRRKFIEDFLEKA